MRRNINRFRTVSHGRAKSGDTKQGSLRGESFSISFVVIYPLKPEPQVSAPTCRRQLVGANSFVGVTSLGRILIRVWLGQKGGLIQYALTQTSDMMLDIFGLFGVFGAAGWAQVVCSSLSWLMKGKWAAASSLLAASSFFRILWTWFLTVPTSI